MNICPLKSSICNKHLRSHSIGKHSTLNEAKELAEQSVIPKIGLIKIRSILLADFGKDVDIKNDLHKHSHLATESVRNKI